MTGNSGLISIGLGMNSRASNEDRMEMETVVAVGGDVEHGWLCLDLVGRMVVRGGDGEPWLQLSELLGFLLRSPTPMHVFRVFRLAFYMI